MSSRRDCRFLGFYCITRRDDNHIWDNPSDSHIFYRLMSGAVGADGNSAMRAGDFYILIIIANRRSYLLPISAGRKHSVRRDERNFADRRHAGSERRHILFPDADLHESVWKFFFENGGAGGIRQIGAKRHNIRIFLSGNHQPLSIAKTSRYL